LFCGAGGLSLGFTQCGFVTSLANDIERLFESIWSQIGHWKELPIIVQAAHRQDIRRVEGLF